MSTTIAWYREGGPLMTVIALVAAIGLGIFCERFYVIVIKSKNNGRKFIERVIQLVRAGKIDEAIKECAQTSAALPDMGLLILRSRSRVETDLQNVADAASLSMLPKLTRRLAYLTALAKMSVLLGLFGTILGVQRALTAFGGGATDGAAHLAVGVAAALSSTGFALLVAAVLSIGRVYLVSQSEGLIEQIQEFSARLINALIDRPDVRLGHR